MTFVLGILMFSSLNVADEVDMECLGKTETNGNQFSYNIAGRAIGICQITEVCLNDYNEFNPWNQFCMYEMFNPIKNYRVAHWYLHFVEILAYKQLIKVKVDDLLIAYTWGPGRYRDWYKRGKKNQDLPGEVRRYLKRYHQYLGEKNARIRKERGQKNK